MLIGKLEEVAQSGEDIEMESHFCRSGPDRELIEALCLSRVQRYMQLLR